MALREICVRVGQHATDVLESDAVFVQGVRVEFNAHRRQRTSPYDHLSHSAHLGKLLRKNRGGGVVHLSFRQRFGDFPGTTEALRAACEAYQAAGAPPETVESLIVIHATALLAVPGQREAARKLLQTEYAKLKNTRRRGVHVGLVPRASAGGRRLLSDGHRRLRGNSEGLPKDRPATNWRNCTCSSGGTGSARRVRGHARSRPARRTGGRSD